MLNGCELLNRTNYDPIKVVDGFVDELRQQRKYTDQQEPNQKGEKPIKSRV